MSSREIVQDQSTNNLHYRGEDREDNTPTALCNKRYRVFTYEGEGQEALAREWDSWNRCPRCEKKAGAR